MTVHSVLFFRPKMPFVFDKRTLFSVRPYSFSELLMVLFLWKVAG